MHFNKSMYCESPSCDLCGNTPIPETIKTAKSISLCPDCTGDIHSMPDVLGESVERFLLGNVL